MKQSSFLGLMAILWGGWVLVPAWDSFSISSAYSVMLKILPEMGWGILVFALGLVTLAANRQKWMRVEIGLSFALSFIWGLIAMSFLFSNIAAVGAPTYFVWCIYGADTATKLLIQYRQRIRG